MANAKSASVKGPRSVAARMASAVRAPFDRGADAVRAILGMVFALVSLEELASLLAAPDKCRTIAEFIRDTIRGAAVKCAHVFPTWKKIRVGVRKNADEFRKALVEAGQKLGTWGDDVLGKIVFPSDMVEEEVEFVRVSNADLGFPDGATKDQSEKAALDLGLVKCQPWDGPAIREAYTDQPVGEWFIVMMDPITGSDRRPYVFRVARSAGGSWLSADYGDPQDQWGGDTVWVFRRKPLAVRP